MRNLALIGGGYWGKNLIRDFNALEDLHTICDINEDALKSYNEKFPNVETTTNWSNVLQNSKISRVCIALPAHLHFKYAKESLLANKDVYVEKPITLDIKEAEELVKIAKEHEKILMVGHLLHYHPAMEVIKNMIKTDKIGQVKSITAHRCSLGIYRTFENVLWSFGVHDISVILGLCNNQLPMEVSCNGKSIITDNIEDITHSILKFKDGTYVSLYVNWLTPDKEQKLTIVGTKGIIIFNDVTKQLQYVPSYVKYENNNPVAIKGNIENVDFSNEFPLIRECNHFVKCCESRTAPITGGEEGVRVLKVLNALQKSLSNNGNPVYLQDNGDIFIHPTATVDKGAIIGKGTKIWHYSHICKDAVIGENCNIGQNVFIAGGAKIGNNCKVQNNVSIYSGVEAGDYVFFGPSCVLTNDINPRCMYSKGGKYVKTIIEDCVTIGANATIVCGNTLGKGCLIGAGSVICKDTRPYKIIVGNPGKVIGDVNDEGKRTYS